MKTHSTAEVTTLWRYTNKFIIIISLENIKWGKGRMVGKRKRTGGLSCTHKETLDSRLCAYVCGMKTFTYFPKFSSGFLENRHKNITCVYTIKPG